LLEHLCEIQGTAAELCLGDFDNYTSEIKDTASELYSFAPQVVFLLPSASRCKYYEGPGECQVVELTVQLAPFLGLNAAVSAHQNRQVKSAWYNS
jgi:hypothetical protein